MKLWRESWIKKENELDQDIKIRYRALPKLVEPIRKYIIILLGQITYIENFQVIERV